MILRNIPIPTDEIHWNLFSQAEKTLDQLFTKYLRAAGNPEPAFRWDNGLWVEFALQEAKAPLKTPARILELLQKNPNLTVPELAKQLSKSGSAVQRGVLKLQIAGRLKRAGSRKGGYWQVLK